MADYDPFPFATTEAGDVDGPEVVVTARRFSGDSSGGLPFTYTFSSASNVTAGSPAPGEGGFGNPNGATATIGTVNVQVDDPSHLDKAVRSAENVASAIAYVREMLADRPSSEVITWDGHSMSVGDVLSTIAKTEFVVTDRSYASGGGVGEARFSEAGNNKDFLDYRAFDGQADVGADGKVMNDYADPAYTHGQGMTGIILHEIGHLTPEGDLFRTQSEIKYEGHYGSYQGYVGSAVWQNVEKFSNDFMKAVGDAAHLDISTFSPTFGFNAVAPSTFWPGEHVIPHMVQAEPVIA